MGTKANFGPRLAHVGEHARKSHSTSKREPIDSQ